MGRMGSENNEGAANRQSADDSNHDRTTATIQSNDNNNSDRATATTATASRTSGRA